MRTNWFRLLAVTAALALGGTAQAAVIHHDNFTDGSGTGNGIMDYRSVGSFNVDFVSSRAQSAAISFDFFGSKSTDGDNGWQDNYSFGLNGTTLFEGTFNLGGGGGDKVFTNAGFAFTPVSYGSWAGGKVSVSGFAELMAGNNVFTFAFTSPGPNNGGGQSLGDEGWGVNSFAVEVAAVPLPAGLPLLAGGIAGLAALRLRRRKAQA
jgi:hypothetical protein